MAATHLIQKAGESTWYVRIIVPKDVRHAFGNRTTLTKTTGTSNKAEAMDLRLPILAGWKAQIAAARKVKPEHWQDTLHGQARVIEAIAKDGVLRAHGYADAPIENPAQFLLSNMSRALGVPIEKLDIQTDEQLQQMIALVVEMAKAQKAGESFSLEHSERFRSFLESVAVTSLKGLNPSEIEEAKRIVQAPQLYKPRSPITASRIAAFRTFREKAGLPAKTIDQQQSKLEKLSAYLTTEGKPLEFDSVSEWLESLPLSSKTKAQYLLAGSTFWKWATRYDSQWKRDFKDKANPFAEHDLPKVRGKVKAETARRAFTPTEIARIHQKAKEDNLPTLTALIELGSYTGCRIEELCRLKPEHVIEVDGVRVFNIEDAKTYAGIREVPIHPNLFPLVDHLVANPSEGYLLPSSAGNKYGVRSDSLSKAFGRLKSAMGFGPQHVFHSVRSMVVTQLQRANVPGVLIAELVGHETGTVTFDVYAGGHSVAQKQAAIGKLDYKFN